MYFLNFRISVADCVILDTNNKPLVECRVVPWYKHTTLETTFVSDEIVVVGDGSEQGVDMELTEDATSDEALGYQVINDVYTSSKTSNNHAILSYLNECFFLSFCSTGRREGNNAQDFSRRQVDLD